jgi:hypothetical protein
VLFPFHPKDIRPEYLNHSVVLHLLKPGTKLFPFTPMAAEVRSSEKEDGSLQSSVAGGPRPHQAARELNERRRAALSEVDNAVFSLAFYFYFYFFSLY